MSFCGEEEHRQRCDTGGPPLTKETSHIAPPIGPWVSSQAGNGLCLGHEKGLRGYPSWTSTFRPVLCMHACRLSRSSRQPMCCHLEGGGLIEMGPEPRSGPWQITADDLYKASLRSAKRRQTLSQDAICRRTPPNTIGCDCDCAPRPCPQSGGASRTPRHASYFALTLVASQIQAAQLCRRKAHWHRLPSWNRNRAGGHRGKNHDQ